jgi:hypothetical protein
VFICGNDSGFQRLEVFCHLVGLTAQAGRFFLMSQADCGAEIPVSFYYLQKANMFNSVFDEILFALWWR